jgi:hypothetical protein
MVEESGGARGRGGGAAAGGRGWGEERVQRRGRGGPAARGWAAARVRIVRKNLIPCRIGAIVIVLLWGQCPRIYRYNGRPPYPHI